MEAERDFRVFLIAVRSRAHVPGLLSRNCIRLALAKGRRGHFADCRKSRRRFHAGDSGR